MEYASGGEMFERISKAGRFTEDEVRKQFSLLFLHLSFTEKNFYR
jgi:hypothetical protein